MTDFLSQPAKYRAREPGRLEIAVLQDGDPPLAVEFEAPSDGVTPAKAEAKAGEALHHIRASRQGLARYGYATGLQAEDLPGLTRLALAVESAILSWKRWNYAVQEADGEFRIQPLTAENIGQVLADPDIRAAWMAHWANATGLERDEGNGSAASLNTSSEEAAPLAEGASSSTLPVPEAFPDGAADTAPASS
ncbi:hypothetical protein V7S57_02445 [Caulobacter sp. CCNWLY153]|uniref:hypothetical protein n=1 Tax=unclassified Caulobacter TaxID=2648921 RepID=UPI002FF29F64